MNCELHVVSQQLVQQLNDIISCLRTQENTLTSDIENFQKLHELYYDIRYARVSNRSSMNPSIKMKKELKAIYAYLMLTIGQIHDRQKKKLMYIYSEQMKEELEHPQIDTSRKTKLKTFFLVLLFLFNALNCCLPKSNLYICAYFLMRHYNYSCL